MNYIIVITTFGTKADAEKLANLILIGGLGACCQIDKTDSIYKWKGKIENCEEFRVSIKTKKERYKDLETLIKKNHPYEIPEIIALPILDGSSSYLKWIENAIK